MSKTQVDYNKKYLENNEEARIKQRLHVARSQAKNYILKKATPEDLENFKQYIQQREQQLK